mgnify:CR=1 FL=1
MPMLELLSLPPCSSLLRGFIFWQGLQFDLQGGRAAVCLCYACPSSSSAITSIFAKMSNTRSPSSAVAAAGVPK